MDPQVWRRCLIGLGRGNHFSCLCIQGLIKCDWTESYLYCSESFWVKGNVVYIVQRLFRLWFTNGNMTILLKDGHHCEWLVWSHSRMGADSVEGIEWSYIATIYSVTYSWRYLVQCKVMISVVLWLMIVSPWVLYIHRRKYWQTFRLFLLRESLLIVEEQA